MSDSPKFKVGQVVAIKRGGYARLITPREAGRPKEEWKELFDSDGYVYVSGAPDPWYCLSELRPLTKRERWSAR